MNFTSRPKALPILGSLLIICLTMTGLFAQSNKPSAEWNAVQMQAHHEAQVHDILGTEAAFHNPQGHQYYLSPSAIPLAAGEWYYRNQMVTLNSIRAGLTDHISAGAGMEVVTAIMSVVEQETLPVFFVEAQASTQLRPGIYAGAGIKAAQYMEPGEGMGLAHGMVTIGNPNRNLTFGAGIGTEYNQNGLAKSQPFGVFHLSGMTRVSPRLSLVMDHVLTSKRLTYENNRWSRDQTLASMMGLRIHGRKASLDLALVPVIHFHTYQDEAGVRTMEADWYELFIGPTIVPYIGFSYPL
ncbi:MAG: hypothetical protein AAFR61_09935 [Bacteroidota bacterium]